MLVCCTGGEEGDILNPAMDTRRGAGRHRRRSAGRSWPRRPRSSATTRSSCSATATRACPTARPTRDPAAFANAALDEAVGRLVAHHPPRAAPGGHHLRRRAAAATRTPTTCGCTTSRSRPSSGPPTRPGTRRRASRGRCRRCTTRSGRGPGSSSCTPSSWSWASSRRTAAEWFDRPWQDDRITTIDRHRGLRRRPARRAAGPRHPDRPDVAVLVRPAREVAAAIHPYDDYILRPAEPVESPPTRPRTTSSPASGPRSPSAARPPFLTQDWLDLQPVAAADFPERPGPPPACSTSSPGRPTARSRYHPDHRRTAGSSSTPRDEPTPSVTLTLTYADALKIAKGELDADRLHAGPDQGGRPTGQLMALMPLLQSAEHRELLATLAAETEPDRQDSPPSTPPRR